MVLFARHPGHIRIPDQLEAAGRGGNDAGAGFALRQLVCRIGHAAGMIERQQRQEGMQALIFIFGPFFDHHPIHGMEMTVFDLGTAFSHEQGYRRNQPNLPVDPQRIGPAERSAAARDNQMGGLAVHLGRQGGIPLGLMQRRSDQSQRIVACTVSGFRINQIEPDHVIASRFQPIGRVLINFAFGITDE